MVTSADIQALVKRRLKPAGDADDLARLELAISLLSRDARTKLAENVARSTSVARRALLRMDFTVTALAGEADLSAMATAAEPLMLDFLQTAEIWPVTPTEGKVGLPLQRKADRSALAHDLPTSFIYYAQHGSKITIKGYDGLIGTFGDDLNITANFIPLNSSIPLVLLEEYVDIIVGMLTIAPGGLGAEKAAEVS